MGQNLVLVCQSHRLPTSRIALASGTSIVGRTKECSIFVSDSTVSRIHAEITVSDGGVLVADLGSRNGTFIGEIQVESLPTAVRLGQELRFGAVRFVLTDDMTDGSNAESAFSTFEVANDRRALVTDSTVTLLTPAQRRVFDCLLKGFSEREVADELKLSQHTVHNHTREIYKIAGVHSRAELLSRMLPNANQ